MRNITRRDLMKGAGAVAAGSALGGAGLLQWANAWAQDMPFKPESGASLRLMRWRRWVQGEEDAFNDNVAAFEKATGVSVRVDNEWLDDVQPKASVAANIGAGPDIVWGMLAYPHLFPDKLVDVTDVADYLGGKYGGWYPIAEEYGKRDGRWIAIVWSVGGNYINYRKSMVQAAGFDGVPGDTDGFLKLCQGLKKNGTPAGMALGHASGDGNIWCHWLVWAFGGRMVDENNNVVINSPETVAALEYGRELYESFIPGTASWLDGHNNKAFLAGQVGLTNNGISIYVKAVVDGMDIADDIDHAFYPVGPVGRPTELQFPQPMVIFQHSKYPNAAKAFITFMLEAPQYNHWLQGSVGYFTQSLRGFDSHPVWTQDAKRAVFAKAAERSLSVGYGGNLGYAAAATLADFIMVDLVSEAVTGQISPKEAAEKAEKRANRYYRV